MKEIVLGMCVLQRKEKNPLLEPSQTADSEGKPSKTHSFKPSGLIIANRPDNTLECTRSAKHSARSFPLSERDWRPRQEQEARPGE